MKSRNMKPRQSTCLLTIALSCFLPHVSCEFKLLLLHTNDMHSRFEETNTRSGECVRGSCYGGFARVKSAVDHFRQQAQLQNSSAIFLNAGDNYVGTVFYTMFKWRIVSELVNMLGIDVMSLGNHEFDDGPGGLAPFISNSSVPIVACNLDYSQESALQDPALTRLVPSWVLTVAGVKVGVIGYLTPKTKLFSMVGNVSILEEITAITKEVRGLREQGVKILIALGHSGYTTDKLIAEQVLDLDVVVGGHTHTFLYSGKEPDMEVSEGPYPTVVTQRSGRKVLVVQAYKYTKYLGHLQLTFDDEGEVIHSAGNPVLLDESFGKDDEVELVVSRYGNLVKESTGRKIGSSKVFLEADNTMCRVRECNFGNFVTDAIVEYNAKDYHGDGWTDAPVAFIQGGRLRASISPEHSGGDIKFSHLLTTIPFQNSIERLVLTGSVLREALEHSVSRYSLEERPGGFLQYSGIQVVYDLEKPPGHRVVSVRVRCGNCSVPQYHPLRDLQEYHVLTNSFLADGGDGFSMLERAKERKTMSFSNVEAVEAHITRLSPIKPELSGRIQFLEHPVLPASSVVEAVEAHITRLSCYH